MSCSTSSQGSGVRPAVEDRDRVPGGARGIDEVTAHEARPAEHENPHARELTQPRGCARAGQPVRSASAAANRSRTREVLDARERVGVERRHEHLLGLAALEAARHEEEEQLRVDPADRRGVRAAHVVGEDLEARDRVGVRVAGEQQVAVLLEGVRALRALVDLDDPAPDRARVAAQRALVGEVAGGVRRGVLLRGVEVEVLALAERVEARSRARPSRARRGATPGAPCRACRRGRARTSAASRRGRSRPAPR